MIDENEIEIDGEARHVPEEQVDRCAALQREDPALEHDRRNLGQQPGGSEVGGVHALQDQQALFRAAHPSLLATSGQLFGIEFRGPGKIEFSSQCQTESERP